MKRGSRASIGVLLAAAMGCDRGEPLGVERAGLAEETPLVAMVMGAARATTAADTTLLVDYAARALALSLADSGLRRDFRMALARSTAREGKIHLQRFFRSRGAEVGDRIGARIGLGGDRWRALLDQVADLEAYVPVAGHSAGWRGTDDVLVAGVINRDEQIRAAGGLVRAYGTDGRPVSLSVSATPTRPVIVMVPAETEFGPDGESAPARVQGLDCVYNCGGGGAGPTDGVYLTRSEIFSNSYESWIRGLPEYAVAIFGLDPATGTYSKNLGCINEDAVGSGYYDQDGAIWTGSARLSSVAALQAAIDRGEKPIVYVWEDDNGSKCDFTPEGSDSVEIVTSRLAVTFALLIGAVVSPNPVAAVAFAFGAVLGPAFYLRTYSADDLVGNVSLPAGMPSTTDPRWIENVVGGPPNRGLMTLERRVGY